ncbi:DUF4157 domain-containing protein [Stenomitos frigidus]|nr:DUF4157 domain-containing protein [Stenomitos frigidus]
MTELRQVQGKGAKVSRSFSLAASTVRRAKLPGNTAEFEAMHDVAQRPQFGGLAGELGVTSAGVPIQAKMRVGEANDCYEQEADRLAPLIVRQINAPGFGEELQDSQSEMQEDVPSKQLQALRPTLQLKGESTGRTVPSPIDFTISSARGAGQPLEPVLQERFGQAMGVDFSGVRIHADVRSDKLNCALNSLAFTTKKDLFFQIGKYLPRSISGQQLIAHELVHVMQQCNPPSKTRGREIISSQMVDSKEMNRQIQSEAEVIQAKLINTYGGEKTLNEAVEVQMQEEEVYLPLRGLVLAAFNEMITNMSHWEYLSTEFMDLYSRAIEVVRQKIEAEDSPENYFKTEEETTYRTKEREQKSGGKGIGKRVKQVSQGVGYVGKGVGMMTKGAGVFDFPGAEAVFSGVGHAIGPVSSALSSGSKAVESYKATERGRKLRSVVPTEDDSLDADNIEESDAYLGRFKGEDGRSFMERIGDLSRSERLDAIQMYTQSRMSERASSRAAKSVFAGASAVGATLTFTGAGAVAGVPLMSIGAVGSGAVWLVGKLMDRQFKYRKEVEKYLARELVNIWLDSDDKANSSRAETILRSLDVVKETEWREEFFWKENKLVERVLKKLER